MDNYQENVPSSKISSLFRNRFVQAILVSGLFLQIGIWVRNYAILLYVVDQTNGDPFAVSMISVAEFAPIFLFSFVGGTFADRWRPKKTMIWCDILSAISIFFVLIALLFFTWKVLFFAMLFSAILSQFSQPSGMKLFKLHVPAEHMQSGMSLYQSLFSIFMIFGPILGTFVFQQFGINVAISITVISFLLSAIALLFLPADLIVKEETQNQTSLLQEMREGVKYVLSSKVLRSLGGAFFMAGTAIGLIQPLAIFLVTEQLHLPKENLQWLIMMNGIGMLAGGALALLVAKKLAPQRMLVIGLIVNAIVISISGLSEILWLTLIAQFFAGMGMPIIQIGINTMIMQHTASEFIGRVNGTLTPLFIGATVVMMSVTGLLKANLSLTWIYQISGLTMLLGVLFLLPLLRLSVLKPELVQVAQTETEKE
ncbi:Predicted arabinose efflux permease, MFS family [Thermoactinomyces sp. DSM 45891]|uniref:MFS transporter n=1 Tax=Thermoactinomyces sp. DSM 45891 TaxID=1761907 RepID=UPI00091057AC|nr:MFS transporter [Thermoactinomyces sp. DSM 45891]SFX69648.1 Predicted arabinose efflux permease, MFS family [Thermoactinomyces sp. DSM 45891]